MCDLTNMNPFGLPYKIAMKKIRGPSATIQMEPGALRNVVDKLFPEHPTLMVTSPAVNEDVSLLGVEDMNCAVEQQRLKKTKAAGPNGIPDSVWLIVHHAVPPPCGHLAVKLTDKTNNQIEEQLAMLPTQ